MECYSRNCSRENTKLGAMLTFEKANISYGNVNCENVGLFTPKSLQNKHIEKKGSDKEELVRYMSSLPTYLQGGKPQQEKAFNVGVLDWKHLERWQSKVKQMPSSFNVVSPPSSSSNASSFSSTEDSSSNSSREYLAPYLMKVKLDFKSCKTVRIGRQEPVPKRAQLEVAITNGVPQFRFSVEKEDECVTATIKRFSSSTKNSDWIYTFSTVHDMKKKKKKKKDRNKVTRNISSVVVAQMKVSDVQLSDVISREFVLFNTSSINQQTSELAAIVVKFSVCEKISMNVILPGGDHGLPRKGEPSSLIERWKSGGSCDCGGWDLGCKLRILANDSGMGRKSKVQLSDGHFELFSQGGDHQQNMAALRLLGPSKDGILSVEYTSSLKLLQAFSICLAVLNVRKRYGS